MTNNPDSRKKINALDKLNIVNQIINQNITYGALVLGTYKDLAFS